MNPDFTSMNLAHVEDDPTDLSLLTKVLRDVGYEGEYHHFETGDQLIEWLRKEGVFRDGVVDAPDLILLDIGLPGITGKDVLKILREDDRLARIPVVMLSGSNSERDYLECIRLGCNGYLVKSADWTAFKEICRSFLDAWSRTSKQRFV